MHRLVEVKVAQLCLTLRILQARRLEWVTFPFSRGSFQPRDRTQVSTLQADSLLAEAPGKPHRLVAYFPTVLETGSLRSG